MTAFEIAVLLFCVVGFVVAVGLTFKIDRIESGIGELLRRDDESRAERERNAFVPINEPTPLPVPDKAARIRSMWGNHG